MYITPSSECNSNIDTHSSLFCISSQLLLKTKHFSLSIQQKLAKSVEVRLSCSGLEAGAEKAHRCYEGKARAFPVHRAKPRGNRRLLQRPRAGCLEGDPAGADGPQGEAGDDEPEGDSLEERAEADLTEGAAGDAGTAEKQDYGEGGA